MSWKTLSWISSVGHAVKSVRMSKTRSSLRGKWFVTVILATRASVAISAIVTSSKPSRMKSRVATSEMFRLVSCFFWARSPSLMAVTLLGRTQDCA